MPQSSPTSSPIVQHMIRNSKSEIGTPVLVGSTNSTVNSNANVPISPSSKREKKEKKEKKSKKEKKDKKEKKESSRRKEKRESSREHREHKEITQSTSSNHNSHNHYNEDEGVLEKPNLKRMLTKFFGIRPSKEDLVKKKILNALYEDE